VGGAVSVWLWTFGLLMGGGKVRIVMHRSWPPGSADVPVGSHSKLVADGDVGAPRECVAREVVVVDVWPADGGRWVVVDCGVDGVFGLK